MVSFGSDICTKMPQSASGIGTKSLKVKTAINENQYTNAVGSEAGKYKLIETL